MNLRFTQKVKDNWLKALKSGKFKKETGQLNNKDNTRHCCIGVLGVIHPKLISNDHIIEEGKICPYDFLDGTIGENKKIGLYSVNDKYDPISEDGYEEAIKFIERLEVTK